jgi:hypothetical protein
MSGWPLVKPSRSRSGKVSRSTRRFSARNGGAPACGLEPLAPMAWQGAHILAANARPCSACGLNPLSSLEAATPAASKPASERVTTKSLCIGAGVGKRGGKAIALLRRAQALCNGLLVQAALALAFPLPPVRWPYVDRSPGLGVDPQPILAAAGKGKRVGAVAVNDRQLQVAVVWRPNDIFPLHDRNDVMPGRPGFDLDQRPAPADLRLI